MRLLLSMGVLMVAAALVIGSGANFTSSSANPSNVFTAGNLSHSNSKDGSAILTADKMKPGDVATGSVTLENDGDIDGTFTLSKTVTASTAGIGGLTFDSKLDLTIYEGATQIWSGKIGDAFTSDPLPLGTWAPGESHTYDFAVTFPDGGSGGADNGYKKASITVQFDWTSVQ
ncbi:MAG: TasA family protein [Thermoleophilia bacterium]